MDEKKSQEQSWISDSLSIIGCEKVDSIKLLESVNKDSKGSFITSGKNSFILGLEENAIGMYKLPNSLVSGIQYAEVYNSIPIKSTLDSLKDSVVQSAVPSSFVMDSFKIKEFDYSVKINSPSSLPNFLSRTGLYDNPMLKINSSEHNFINKLSSNALSTNYISLSKSDQTFNSINDLHSIHKFGFSPKGSLDLITDHNHIADANLFASKSSFHIGTTGLGFISGNIISERNTPDYFENILETRLNSYKSDLVNYVYATINHNPTFNTNYQIYIASNEFSIFDINDMIDLKLKVFNKELEEKLIRDIGHELHKFKIELDKEGLFEDSFDIIPYVGTILKLGLKALKVMNDTRTIPL